MQSEISIDLARLENVKRRDDGSNLNPRRMVSQKQKRRALILINRILALDQKRDAQRGAAR